jgi:L-threonylcarbamoyladenylate synthase
MSRVLDAEALSARLAVGEAVLFPTDTLPALACAPSVAPLLWRLKCRPPDKPLILMGADLDQLVGLLGVSWHAEWLEQAHRSWPGATTLVLPIAGPLVELLNPGGASLGLRVPAAPLACDLLRRSGPLATTSANPSGASPAIDADEAAAAFPGLALLAPLPWPPASGAPSRVLAWRETADAVRDGWQVLRPGPIGNDPVAPPAPGGGGPPC